MSSLLKQIKNRRLALGFKQTDMQDRVGILRQVYQRLESKGNPRLATLELVATGLNSELMLVPLEKVAAVTSLLEDSSDTQLEQINKNESLEDDPWNDILSNVEADS
jgi:transcriptional regulator with XRE-family HTH domain